MGATARLTLAALAVERGELRRVTRTANAGSSGRLTPSRLRLSAARWAV